MPENHSFSTLKLLPGTRLDFRSEQYSQMKGISEFIGFQDKKTIIVTVPILNGSPVSCKKGAQVTLRFFVNHLNCACAFRCSIVHLSAQPFPHLHLSVPDAIQVGEVRKSARAKVSLACEAFIQTEADRGKASKICNLSVDGALLESHFVLGEEGQFIKLKANINMLDEDRDITLKAKICSVKEMDHAYAYGLMLVDIDDDMRLLIHAYVLEELFTNQ